MTREMTHRGLLDRCLWTALWIACFWALPLSPAIGQEDADRVYSDSIIFLSDDGQMQTIDRVRVDRSTYEGIDYTLRGGRTTASKTGAQVLSITYGDAPRVYLQGLRLLEKKQFKAAASDFHGAKNAVEAVGVRKWLLEYAAVKRGLALLGLGRTDADKLANAVSSFEEALAANPKSLLFNEIQQGLVECHILLKEWSEANSAAEKLLSVGQTIKQPAWQACAGKALAKILEVQGRYAEAVTAYQNLVSLAQRESRYAKSRALKNKLLKIEMEAAVDAGWARVAWADSSGSQTDWDAARSHFQGLGSKYPDDDGVAAAMLNGLGRCMLKKDPRGALDKFVEAEVSHFTARREVARALHLKALALDAIGGSYNRRMAELARKELRELFPNSEWARK